MPQIGFTDKQAEVYHRFNALRRAYEDANGGGRVYNPDFLAVLMDGWKELERMANNEVPVFTIDGQVMGFVTTGFLEQHFLNNPTDKT